MREPQRKEIGGRTYQVTPLPAGKGLALLTMVAKVLGPALAGAASLAEASAGLDLGAVFERLDEGQVERACRTFAETTMVERSPGDGKFVALKDCFDVHFAGDYATLVAWARFAFEVNFGSFLGALRGADAAPAASPPAALRE